MANEKHIFIGIGGQGVKTVAKIKNKVYEKRFPKATESKSRLQAMEDSYRFLFIDTDQRDIDNENKENRESFEDGRVPFINPQKDLINLGRANPSAIYYEAKRVPDTLINKRIIEACSPELATKIPDQPLSFGAGAFRIKSRIAFAHSLADFQAKLQAAISSLNDVKTVGGSDSIIYYWLVSSSLGGTGSGIFNDVLYHINQLHHQIVGNGDPQLVYTLYMPKVFIDANSTEEKYSLNAFGVFSELEAFKKMSYDDKTNTVMHRLAFNNDYNLVDSKKRYCPFYYVIPIDIQTDKGTSLGSPNTMIQNTAEMLFHLHNGQAGATFRSDIDNYMNDIMEKNHEEFLVPMGYVSLQKPIEQFNRYMRTRFRRDVLRSWLVCNNKKQANVSKEEGEKLLNEIFNELTPTGDTEGKKLLMHADIIKEKLSAYIPEGGNTAKMPDDYSLDNILGDLNEVDKQIAFASTDEEKAKYKKLLVDNLWKIAEGLIRDHGVAYAHNAIVEVRNQLKKEYKKQESSIESKEIELQRIKNDTETPQGLAYLFNETKVKGIETVGWKDNKLDIQAYISAMLQYVEEYSKHKIQKWAHEIKRDFQNDEKNDELSKLAIHLSGLITKAEEMSAEAAKSYKDLSMKFADTAMDVTTVYLPMLKEICDGNGWKQPNFFSKQYKKVINANDDLDETPSRDDLKKFIQSNVYDTTDSELIDTNFIVYLDKKTDDDDDAAPEKTPDVRFFANPVLVDRGNVSNEKIIEEFLKVATKVLEKKLHTNQEIQENWDNRKISAFFNELSNEQKDEVRNSLNPALFFSYNNNRIDVTKKEDRIIFVAGNEDLAAEMLGYQKGNTKHRFEKGDSDNVALVLKSKFGLALRDYRIYDAIKMVYDKANFRQKYHFHNVFAEYGEDLTIDKLPYDILPQHHSYVKMLILDAFRKELSPFFYADEYDPEAYIDTMYFSDYDKSFKIALSEALVTDPAKTEGQIGIRTEADGRQLFMEIEGLNFIDRFNIYTDLYHNARFGETTERLIQAILRAQVNQEGGKTLKGEHVLKEKYTEKHKELLSKLNKMKQDAVLPEEKRLYSIFFNILKDNYATVNEFKK